MKSWFVILGCLIAYSATHPTNLGLDSNETETPTPSPAGSNSPVPINMDVAEVIANHLSTSDLANLKKSCKHWNDVFQFNFQQPKVAAQLLKDTLQKVPFLHEDEVQCRLIKVWKLIIEDDYSMLQVVNRSRFDEGGVVFVALKEILDFASQANVPIPSATAGLTVASANGLITMAELLLPHSTPNSQCMDIAVRNHHIPIIRLLAQNGIPVDTPDSKNLLLSIEENWEDQAVLLATLGSNVTARDYLPVLKATWNNMYQLVKILLDDKGVPAHLFIGRLLEQALQHNQEPLVTMLLEGERKNFFSQISFHRALYTGVLYQQKECVLLLLERAGELIDINYDNGKVLELAARRGDEDIIRILAEHGADFSLNNYSSIKEAVNASTRTLLLQLCGLDPSSFREAANTSPSVNSHENGWSREGSNMDNGNDRGSNYF